MAALSFDGVSFGYVGKDVISDLTLTVNDGDVVAIIGPSGQGKSTLLKLAAGIINPSSGFITAPGKGRIGFVFQTPELLPWKTSLDNAALPLELLGTPIARARATSSELLERVGLSDALDKFPHEMSHGMQMRCSLARALSTDPSLLLLDEPFSALDELVRRRVLKDTSDVISERRMTALLVAHTVQEAAYLADRVHVLGVDGSLSQPIETGTDRSNNPITRLESLEVATLSSMMITAMEPK